jgi:hypothetical protein
MGKAKGWAPGEARIKFNIKAHDGCTFSGVCEHMDPVDALLVYRILNTIGGDSWPRVRKYLIRVFGLAKIAKSIDKDSKKLKEAA